MERLTSNKDVSEMNLREGLKYYEDLEERLRAVYGECNGLLEKVVEQLERHEGIDLPAPVFKSRLLTDGEVDQWEEFKGLEEQGKLLKLPCAVGDVIYKVSPNYVYADMCEITGFAECTSTKSMCYTVYIDPDEEDIIALSDFGKTVFLTKEAALKKLEAGNGA